MGSGHRAWGSARHRLMDQVTFIKLELVGEGGAAGADEAER